MLFYYMVELSLTNVSNTNNSIGLPIPTSSTVYVLHDIPVADGGILISDTSISQAAHTRGSQCGTDTGGPR